MFLFIFGNVIVIVVFSYGILMGVCLVMVLCYGIFFGVGVVIVLWFV